MLSITYTERKIHIWEKKANTLLYKSEDRSGPGQLECGVVQGVSRRDYEVCGQEVWKCAFLSSNNWLFF